MIEISPTTIDMIIMILAIGFSWLVSQLLKLFWMKKPKLYTLLYTSGGMPSSHTATLATLTVFIFLYEGFTTTFAVAGLITLIVIRDAMGVRYASGHNAQILKRSLNKKDQHKVIVEEGHTKKEIIVGFIVGAVVAVLAYTLTIAVV